MKITPAKKPIQLKKGWYRTTDNRLFKIVCHQPGCFIAADTIFGERVTNNAGGDLNEALFEGAQPATISLTVEQILDLAATAELSEEHKKRLQAEYPKPAEREHCRIIWLFGTRTRAAFFLLFQNGHVTIGDLKGYFKKNGDNLDNFTYSLCGSMTMETLPHDANRKLLDSVELWKANLRKLLAEGTDYPVMRDFDDRNTGERLAWGFNGKEFFILNPQTKYPDGWPEYSVEIQIPTGELVIDDDLRQHVPDVPEDMRYSHEFSCNHEAGAQKHTEYYAKHNMGHGFIGNSCAHIYQRGDKIIIGRFSEEKPRPAALKGFKDIGSVCTDLWWYSILDAQFLKPKVKISPCANRTKVSPGTYRLTHRYHRLRNRDTDGIYATLEKVS